MFTSINKHKMIKNSANINIFYFIAINRELGQGELKQRVCITLEWNQILFPAQVNLNKVLHTSVWYHIDEDLVGSHQMFEYFVQFTCARTKLKFHSSVISNRCGLVRLPSDVSRTYFVCTWVPYTFILLLFVCVFFVSLLLFWLFLRWGSPTGGSGLPL